MASMLRLAAICALGLLAAGCKPKAPAFAQPPPFRPHEGPLHAGDDPPPPDPDGCVVEFQFPERGRVGQYPSFQIEARPPIVYRGQGPEPTALVLVVAPDGSRDELSIPLPYPPICAYCLPAKGSDGCDHDCRWEPFTQRVESVHLKVPGPHHVSVRLTGSACRVIGGRARIEAVTQP